MRTDLFDYELPPELIAQTPMPRGESRLLVLRRADGGIEHRKFSDILEYLRAGDTLVVNDTRVSARRLRAVRENGLPAEVLLLRPVGETGWEALVRPARPLRPGRTVTLLGPNESERVVATVVEPTPEGGRVIDVGDRAQRDRLATWGTTPLPPYIHESLPTGQENRYQTVYAAHNGSAAAPTAGLHFTPELLASARQRDIDAVAITLHVGVGTFRPVREETIEDHVMHAEWVHLTEDATARINATRGRVVAVGTTSVRTLETAAQAASVQDGLRCAAPFCGETRLFITPGFAFRATDAVITNFHLPKSTLLMLVCAFAGRDAVLHAYEEAVREEYRFFSFGDAMLII